jgi:magnesium transporter
MLHAYRSNGKAIALLTEREMNAKPNAIAWIDLHNPTRLEEVFVEQLLSTSIPTREEMHEIELSNRLYIENGTIYATASIVTRANTDEPEINAATFVIVGQCLVTIRYSDPTPFKSFVRNAHKDDLDYMDGVDILVGLQEAIISRMADILESVARKIDEVSRALFYKNADELQEKPNLEIILRTIGLQGDLISKTRESLVSVARLMGFISQAPSFKSRNDIKEKLSTLTSDIHALNDHASFLNTKVGFLLDTTLGMISMEQNSIIKIFSVAAVIFLPPTLVASIYGMNFHFMPELDWHYGYPMAIGLMVLSAFVPYKFFKKKGWL